MPYYLAIQAFVQLCKRFPEIRSVYLRHGLLREDWVPAISDIDLSVIIDHRVNMEEELAFLRSFWKSHDTLKKLFPMLNDVNILNEGRVGSVTKFNILGYESNEWRLIYGEEAVESNYIATSARLVADSFDHALLCYLNLFLKRFYEREQPTRLVAQEMHRLTSKILRYTNYLEPDHCNAEFDSRVGDRADMLCLIITAFEKRIRDSPALWSSGNSVNGGREWLTDFASRNVFLETHALNLEELSHPRNGIESIYFSHDNNIIVLKDGLDASAVRRCAEIAVRSLRDYKPAIVSRSMFEYMVRFYNPFLYTHLVLCRKVAFGYDPLPDFEPPELPLFIRRVLEQTPNVLTLLRSRELISPANSAWFAEKSFESLVERALCIKLYLENRVIRPWYRELVTECQGYYPQHCEKLREIIESVGYASASSLSGEAFRLLRRLGDDIHDCLTIFRLDEELFQTDRSNIRKLDTLTRVNSQIAGVEKGPL